MGNFAGDVRMHNVLFILEKNDFIFIEKRSAKFNK